MLEYILQTIFLFSVLFVYMLSGSVVYSAVGEGYKATPLRCFAVGVGFWILLVILSTVFFAIKIEYLWWLYVSLTIASIFFLPQKDQSETLDKEFYLQVLTSFAILLPLFLFLGQDKLHLWQEFAIYGKGLFSLLGENYITADFLKDPVAYQLAILPVGYFTTLQDNIFACFNIAVLAFVGCEFVRNSGVRIALGNIVFPLVIAFALLLVLNPFSVTELMLSADPFIFICAIGFAFAEYIFRHGYLPKSLAGLPPTVILMLLAFSSTQGFLLSCSLFIVLSLRYALQFKTLNHKQLIGYLLMPMLSVFMVSLWQFYLNKNGLAFLLFDTSQVSLTSISLFYKAIFVLAKQHIAEVIFVLSILILGLVSFSKVKKLDDVILDKYLLRSVFWVVLIYVFICIPVFFSQYSSVAKASYSLGFSSIALIQFIILMPIGRLIKDGLDHLDLKISRAVKITIILALLVIFVMNKNILDKQQNPRIDNMQEIALFIQKNIPKDSKLAVLDINKSAKFYQYILDYKDNNNLEFIAYDVAKLKAELRVSHQEFSSANINYVLLHAPTNLLIKSFEHNLNPQFTYLYKINPKGFYLVKKFENKLYKDTNISI